ncbi:hypothetical protein GNF80_10905 [Clostridium perfringens]|nr:hypothetical protein [Clostridium perfringens]
MIDVFSNLWIKIPEVKKSNGLETTEIAKKLKTRKDINFNILKEQFVF